ncbi:MAG: sugar nucleotide-binding protein, partial [Pseudomonadota bacterium]
LAKVCLLASKNKVVGIYHWTDAGVASWYDFAVAIQEIAFKKNIITTQIPINPIQAKEYPLPAERPTFSVLDKSSCIEKFNEISLIHWRTQLSTMMDELMKQ